MARKFNLRSYLSHLSDEAKCITIPRLVELGEITPAQAQDIMSSVLEQSQLNREKGDN